MRVELKRMVRELKGSESKLRRRGEHTSADWLLTVRNQLEHILTRLDWIPVSERLPEGDRIWCWVEHEDADDGVLACSLAQWLKGGFRWPGTLDRIDRVLHYQLLEEPRRSSQLTDHSV